MEFESSGDHSEHEHGLDTIQAITGWWAYEKDGAAVSGCAKPDHELNESEGMNEESIALVREARRRIWTEMVECI